jgi:hypothetical protein
MAYIPPSELQSSTSPASAGAEYLRYLQRCAASGVYGACVALRGDWRLDDIDVAFAFTASHGHQFARGCFCVPALLVA